MARIIFRKTFPEKSNNRNYPKIQKSTCAMSSAVWDRLSQVFKYYRPISGLFSTVFTQFSETIFLG